MIWDSRRRREAEANGEVFNAEDAEVGNFEHPEFFEQISSGFGGDRTNEEEQAYAGPSIARIVGGAVAKPYSYPWMVRVRACSGYACTRMCGGTLVSDRAVVTASHCIPPYAQTGLITLGAHEYYNTRAMNVTIDSIHQHPGWNKSTRINDIAVIILAESVAFNNKIQPACLPNKDHCFAPGTACVATGWGYIKEGGPRSSLLREVPVRMMTREHCNKPDYYSGRILEGMMCAGYNEGRRDACTGDSGGPLVCPLNNGRWVLAGVTSWGVGCARFKRPGVYSRVADFSDWIASIIKQYPSVVGTCKPKGNGYGFGGDWSWTGKMPAKKPMSQLFQSSGNSYGADKESISWAKPVTTKRTTTTRRPTTRRTTTRKPTPPKPFFPDQSDQSDLAAAWYGSSSKPTNKPKPFYAETPAPIDPFKEAKKEAAAQAAKEEAEKQAAALEAEKGANPCIGLTGKRLKKCKAKASGGGKPPKQKKDKSQKKKDKKAKKMKKQMDKTLDFEIMDGMSKKDRKAYKKQKKERALEMENQEFDQDRSDGVIFDAAESTDNIENQKFAEWDYSV